MRGLQTFQLEVVSVRQYYTQWFFFLIFFWTPGVWHDRELAPDFRRRKRVLLLFHRAEAVRRRRAVRMRYFVFYSPKASDNTSRKEARAVHGGHERERRTSESEDESWRVSRGVWRRKREEWLIKNKSLSGVRLIITADSLSKR